MHIQAVEDERQFADAERVRIEVFVHEQGVDPDSEHDAIDDDPRTLHVVAYDDDGEPIGAGRLIAPHTDTMHGPGTPYGAMDPAHPHIGRLAVTRAARGTGAGAALMSFLEKAALERHGAGGAVRVELSAQEQAMPFYERLGYIAHGEPYMDEGIRHFDAYKDLTA